MSLYRTEPDVAFSNCSTVRAVVDLPQPDSPTRPRVSRSPSSNETPQTACASPTWCLISLPPWIGKCLTRSVTVMTGSPTDGLGTDSVVDTTASSSPTWLMSSAQVGVNSSVP